MVDDDKKSKPLLTKIITEEKSSKFDKNSPQCFLWEE